MRIPLLNRRHRQVPSVPPEHELAEIEKWLLGLSDAELAVLISWCTNDRFTPADPYARLLALDQVGFSLHDMVYARVDSMSVCTAHSDTGEHASRRQSYHLATTIWLARMAASGQEVSFGNSDLDPMPANEYDPDALANMQDLYVLIDLCRTQDTELTAALVQSWNGTAAELVDCVAALTM